MKEQLQSELADLLTVGGGDHARSKALAADIATGKLALPPCFNVKGGTTEQTARVHEIARLLTAN